MGPTITKDSGIPEPTNIVSNFGKGGSGGGDPGAPGMKSKGWNAIIKEENMNGVTNRNSNMTPGTLLNYYINNNNILGHPIREIINSSQMNNRPFTRLNLSDIINQSFDEENKYKNVLLITKKKIQDFWVVDHY